MADFYNNRILHFDADANFLAAWGSEGNKQGQFNGPTGVAVSMDGFVIIADWGNHRVQRFPIHDQD